MPEEPHALDAADLVVSEQGPAPEGPDLEHPDLGHAAPDHPAPGHPGQEVPEAPAAQRPAAPPRTRISGLWVALGCFGVLLLFALLFVLQNDHSVDITYFGAHGHLPLGVALLLAALCGGMLVTLVGTARILQLRAAARRHQKKS